MWTHHRTLRMSFLNSTEKKAAIGLLMNLKITISIGGEGGIRTLGTIASTPDFESGTFDHSATSPLLTE